MANEHNLKPFTSEQSREEAVRNGQKGGIASGEARREKRDMRERVAALMEMPADPSVARKLSGSGAPVDDMADAVLAALYVKAIKGDVRAFETLMEYSGQSAKENERREIKALEIRRAELEAEKAAMENELYKMRLDAIKGVGQDDLPDDGFLEALKGTAAEDWSDEVL